MKWFNNGLMSKQDSLAHLYEVVNLLAGSNFTIEGKNVILPDNQDLNVKIQYSEEPGESKFTVKLQWGNDIPFAEGDPNS